MRVSLPPVTYNFHFLAESLDQYRIKQAKRGGWTAASEPRSYLY